MRYKGNRILVVGDRVLVEPDVQPPSSNLVVPKKTNKVDLVSGLVVEIGPGTPIPFPRDTNEFDSWREVSTREHPRIPLDVMVGDRVYCIPQHVSEIDVLGKRFLVVSQMAILMIVRPERSDSVSSVDIPDPDDLHDAFEREAPGFSEDV